MGRQKPANMSKTRGNTSSVRLTRNQIKRLSADWHETTGQVDAFSVNDEGQLVFNNPRKDGVVPGELADVLAQEFGAIPVRFVVSGRRYLFDGNIECLEPDTGTEEQDQ